MRTPDWVTKRHEPGSPPVAMAGIAKQHCANFGSEGICGGVKPCTDGSQVRFLPEGARCLLLEGKGCGYFESNVMPMALESWEWKNPSEGKRFREAVDHYRRVHGEIKGLARRARRCPDCGEPIGPRKRYCQKCAADRQKASVRKTMRKSRLDVKS